MAKAGNKGKPTSPKSTRGKKKPKLENNSPELGNMDKIRDILFGNQMRDVEKRFAGMEEQLNKELSDLKDETRNRLEDFEVFFKNEMEVLKNRLKGESDERARAHGQLVSELKETSASLNKKIALVGDNLAERATGLQEQILEQSKKLSDDIHKKYSKSATDLKKVSNTLDDSKVDRLALAEFLVEMAVHLSGGQNPQTLINQEK